ncbi:Coiled-coil domain-containing protein 84 [Arabidopsis thaliana x Arabidopsis arenosa]|uniref:Coiled-coil domain-containing protein 84 n=1 Tax=Arabidopsis thaliana x Arabidopsis arenosa TaxID=1240361 RepID=A0A8T1Y5N1_9BRAS|nr:Coiled-coil domain-containing protein 84 [Arabidopsis thaliana x Arabidopsis arenosa]
MKKPSKKSEIEFCKVCRLHHDQGSRHKYFPRHKSSLSSLLDRFRSKIADVRFFLKNPSVLRPQEQSQNRVWCVFCDEDIVELGSSFACSKAITHFASSDHLKNIKQFLSKNGPAMDCVDDFRISEADVAKWEKKCQSLGNEDASSFKGSCRQLFGTSNDIHTKLAFETMDRIEKVPAHHINSHNSNVVMPLQYNTNEYQISLSEIPGVTHYGSYLNMDASHLPLCHVAGNGFGQQSIPCRSKEYSGNGNYCTQENYQVSQDKKQIEGSYNPPGVVGMSSISSSHSTDAGGNVHSGAPPPWLVANDGNVSNIQLNQSDMACVQAKVPRKNCKLNPNRVGAAWAERRKIEIEMEKSGHATNSNIDADWLPNFGRVWQSGTRKESRKEFEKEKRKLVKTESVSTESEPVKIQPYISKRARRESDE